MIRRRWASLRRRVTLAWGALRGPREVPPAPRHSAALRDLAARPGWKDSDEPTRRLRPHRTAGAKGTAPVHESDETRELDV